MPISGISTRAACIPFWAAVEAVRRKFFEKNFCGNADETKCSTSPYRLFKVLTVKALKFFWETVALWNFVLCCKSAKDRKAGQTPNPPSSAP